MSVFKFYIVGGIEGMVLQNAQAFDIDGNEIPNAVASVEHSEM